MSGRFRFLLLIILIVTLFFSSTGMSARIKDIASFKGIRTNQLFGYGLVIGLNGSGDKAGTSFTIQGLVNMLEQMGVHVSVKDVKVSNVAAVMVSATLPPFARIVYSGTGILADKQKPGWLGRIIDRVWPF